MLDGCNNIREDLKAIILQAAQESALHDSPRIGTEYLLLACCKPEQNIAAQALGSMKINFSVLEKEIVKLIKEKDFTDCELSHNDLPGNASLLRLCFNDNETKTKRFSDKAIKAIAQADDLANFLGFRQINAGHLLLAIISQKDSCSNKIFEELSINTSFLKGKTMRLMAADQIKNPSTIDIRSAMIAGLKGLFEKHNSAFCLVQELMEKSKLNLFVVPRKEQIIRAVCMAYLADCLYNQIAFQRYLLEELLATLSENSGALSQDITGQIISSTAQHLRKQVRESIEYIWTDEYRLITHMLNDAEHDLIGSVIEDLWWAYSEDIALDKSFSSALADHRKAHLLDLQSRRVELSKRLLKLKSRLEDTINQCFQQRVKN